MANINKIKLSGTTYNIQDENATKTVELTQAQYDALSVKDPNTFYIITDAQGADLSQYYTSAQTESAITQAVSGKQDTLVSGTNIKTINNESLLGSGNIDIQGGGVNVVQTTGTSTADVMSQSAITNGFNTYTLKRNSDNGEVRYFYVTSPSQPYGGGGQLFFNFSINGRCPLTQTNGSNSYIDKFSLVETSAITTSVTSSSTDAQVPSAKAVYDAIQGGGGGSSYTAGDGIDITNDVISVTGKVDTTAFTAHTADTVIHVTSAEKAAWNAKSDFSGDYDDLTNKPTIPTVPTSNTAFTNDAGYITIDAISGKVDTSTYNTYTAATDTALASKQTTLTAGTGISIVDNVISATGGTSITIDPSLDSGSTNPVANSAITEAITANQNAVLITPENRNSVVEHIENDIYELKTNDIYSISFIPKDLEYTEFRFNGTVNGTYTDISTEKNVDTATTQVSITFDSETNRITVTSLDRDANKIDVTRLAYKTSSGFSDLENNDVYIIHNPSLGVVKTEYEKTIQTSYKESGGYITERKGNTEIKYNYETTSTSNLVNGRAVNAAIDKVKTRFDGFGQSYKGGQGCTDYASQSPNITDFTSGEHSVMLINTNSTRVWWFNIKLNENSTDTFGHLNINFSADGVSFGNLSLFLQMNTLDFRLGDYSKRIDVTDKTQTYSVFVPNGILVNTSSRNAVASYNVWSMTEDAPFFLESIGIFDIPHDSSCLESFDEWKSNVDTDISNLSARTDYAVNTVNNHINDSSIHVTSAEKSTWDAKQDQLVSGTNIKTINNESILGSGNITIEGGGDVTVDTSLDSGSTNPVANSAITNVLSNYYYARKFNNNVYSSPYGTISSNGCIGFTLEFYNIANPNLSVNSPVWLSKINGKTIFHSEYSTPNANTFNLSLVETSAITTSITSDSTDSQVPSAKAVYDALQEGGGGGGMTEDDELLLSTALTDLNDRKIDASEVKSNYQPKGDYVALGTLNTRLAEYETVLDEQNVEEVTAYALNDLNNKFGGLSLVKITESEYAALTTKDENTLYIVVADPSQTR